MFEFLQRLFIGHNHKWEQVERIQLMPHASSPDTMAIGILHVCRCSVCGKIKTFKVNG